MSLLASSAQFILALLFVLALIGVLANLARRFGLAPMARGHAGKGRRLGVSEFLPLDGKRKAVLLRRDGVEHLIILSATSETVVEGNIVPPEDDADGEERRDAGDTARPLQTAALLKLPERARRQFLTPRSKEASG